MTRPRIFAIALLLLLVISFIPRGVVYAAGTDEIKDYTVDIVPQDDGSLLNTYTINWCVISNAAGPLTWITIGMPNDQYEIVSYSGDASSVQANNAGFDYKVRIDLSRKVNAGDCVNVTVQVHQYGMGNLDKTTNQVSFQFTPGWFDGVPVDHLKVTWHLPTDTTQLKSSSPTPTTKNDTQLIWETALQPGEKYPLSVAYDKAAFPNFNPNKTVSTQSSTSNTPQSGQSTAAGANSEPTLEPYASVSDNSTPFSLAQCGCIGPIIVLIVIFAILRIFSGGYRSYRNGGFFGGYQGGGGGGGSIPTIRTGGGSGLFGGRGSSCACVSSGCACACAGGGRAGCSRKGFDVSSLFKNI